MSIHKKNVNITEVGKHNRRVSLTLQLDVGILVSQ